MSVNGQLVMGYGSFTLFKSLKTLKSLSFGSPQSETGNRPEGGSPKDRSQIRNDLPPNSSEALLQLPIAAAYCQLSLSPICNLQS